MRTWLLTWNPKYRGFAPGALKRDAIKAQAGKKVHDNWSCSGNRSIRASDRIFLIRLGVEPRGIFGSGIATSDTYRASAWSGKPNRRPNQYVDFTWDSLLDAEPSSDRFQLPLGLNMLRQGALAQVNWETQASGIEISSELAVKLERLWRAHYTRITRSEPIDVPIEPADGGDDAGAFEGARKRLFVWHRHREQSLRTCRIRDAAAKGPLRCEVPGCGFDFERTYGSLGAGFVEVHHLKPLGVRGRQKRTLHTDLAIVCANCHRMIHHGGECRSLDSLIPRRRKKLA